MDFEKVKEAFDLIGKTNYFVRSGKIEAEKVIGLNIIKGKNDELKIYVLIEPIPESAYGRCYKILYGDDSECDRFVLNEDKTLLIKSYREDLEREFVAKVENLKRDLEIKISEFKKEIEKDGTSKD